MRFPPPIRCVPCRSWPKCKTNTKLGIGKRGPLERGLLKSVYFLMNNSKECRNSRECRKQRRTAHFFEILKNFEIVAILEIPPVKTPLVTTCSSVPTNSLAMLSLQASREIKSILCWGLKLQICPPCTGVSVLTISLVCNPQRFFVY